MYVIRADGGAKVGAGHLMRCLTIADALPVKEEVLFVCAQEESARIPDGSGYRTMILHTDYRNMEEELPYWHLLLERETGAVGSRPVLLIDSYYVTDHYLKELHTLGAVVLLDDMAQHCFPVDVVINYNAFADRQGYQKLYQGTDTVCYTGSSYVPVRKQFRDAQYSIQDSVKNILITTGGGDSENIAGKILNTLLTELEQESICFHVISGCFHPENQELKRQKQTKHRVKRYHNVSDMAVLMTQCDLAVTAGGTTVYELAVVGVPFICFSYADNQEALASYVGKQQIAAYAGAYHREPDKTLNQIREHVVQLIQDVEARRKLNQRERGMTDGLGAYRIANLLSSIK